jgi:xanthine dehydrogenase accessory factor
MGSRRTHDDRMERLRGAGLTEDDLGRLSSPIGLDLGARSPEETAISIAAEIIAGRCSGTGRHLKDTPGRIHDRQDPTLAALDVVLTDSRRGQLASEGTLEWKP